MKTAFRSCAVILLSLFLMQCGGGKKLSTQEVSGMTPIERVQYLEKQVEKNPNDLVLKKNLVKEYTNLDMKNQAYRVMEDILAFDPYQTDVQFEYGELKYKDGEYPSAYRAFLGVMQSGAASSYKNLISQYVAGGYLVQAVTSTASAEGFPVFSADGKKLLYQKKSGNNWDIVEFDIDTKVETVLIGSPADEELPMYAPDGKHVVYTSNADDRRPIDSKYKMREIVQTNLDDQYTATLTQSVADDWLPRYSHNGNNILFVSERSDLRKLGYADKQSDLYIMESDGDFQLQLTKTVASEGGASFSFDDKRVFFHSNINGTFDIFTIKTDGSQQLTVVDDGTGNDVNPSASPDGQWITFVSDRDGNYEIYRAKTNGSGQERLTFNPGVDSNPVYSPDGSMIAFHSNRGGNFNIYLVNLTYQTSDLSANDLINRLTELTN